MTLAAKVTEFHLRVVKGTLGDAIAAYREAIRLNPEYAEAHFNLGTALQAQGKLEEADAEYAEARRLDPDIDKEP